MRRYDLFNPVIACPDGGALKRVGSPEDGGKWLCAEKLEAPCVVYSIGSHGKYDFELAVLDVSSASALWVALLFLAPGCALRYFCSAKSPLVSFVAYRAVVAALASCDRTADHRLRGAHL